MPGKGSQDARRALAAGRINGVDTMMTRLRRRGREYRDLEKRLNEMVLFDRVEVSDDGKRSTPIVATKHRRGDPITVQLILEHRDRYREAKSDAYLAGDVLTELRRKISNDEDEKQPALHGAIKACLENLNLAHKRLNVSIDSMDRVAFAGMAAVQKQVAVEVAVLLEEVRRMRKALSIADDVRRKGTTLSDSTAALLQEASEMATPDIDEVDPDEGIDEPDENQDQG